MVLRPPDTATSTNALSIVLGSDGFPFIAYAADVSPGTPSQALLSAHCDDADCSSVTPFTLDATGDAVGMFVDHVVGTDGFPLIIYRRETSTAGQLMSIHCLDVVCSTIDTPSVLTANGQPEQISVTLGSDGFGVIAFYSAQFDLLYTGHCDNVACTSATFYFHDSYNQGGDVEIIVGSDNLPFVVYEDLQADTLNVVHCTSLDCSTAVVTDITPSTYDDGRDHAVTINTDGNPIIATGNFTDDGIILACANVACTSISTTTKVFDAGGYDWIKGLTLANGYSVFAARGTMSLYQLVCFDSQCRFYDFDNVVGGSNYRDAVLGANGYMMAVGGSGGPEVWLTIVSCGSPSCRLW